jgi:hypothetical protein
MNKNTVFDCRIIELPKISSRSGNITPVTNFDIIPFKIKRVFYIYDIPGGEDRGVHAHRECYQFLVAASGSFDVEMEDGTNKRIVTLNRPYFGILIPPGIWAAEKAFSSGSVCLVLTSEKYRGEDYIRDYNEFLEFKRHDPSNV